MFISTEIGNEREKERGTETKTRLRVGMNFLSTVSLSPSDMVATGLEFQGGIGSHHLMHNAVDLVVGPCLYSHVPRTEN